ncbi:MAG: hypothetical protein GC162_09980 [Planctomycetes bacterium]|nr:hypothetical protein [Planctomycetota bacterium]
MPEYRRWRQVGTYFFTVKSDRDANGSYETTEHIDAFAVDGSGYVDVSPTHDAAGNLTYDGAHVYTYDAWNRLVKATKAYRDPTNGDAVTPGSVVAEYEYDGRHRRIVRKIENSADLDCTYDDYHTGHRIVETRNGSDMVIKQQVWGARYIDELVQIAVNDDPTDEGEQDCETKYYALTNANFNVQALVNDAGEVVERYEYEPYGQRQVYISPGTADPQCYAPTYMSRRVVTSDDVTQPYALNEFGHQGLMHDESLGLIYNRARELHPRFGRFMQRDSIGYIDGMDIYQCLHSNTITRFDPWGLEDRAGTSSSGQVTTTDVDIYLVDIDKDLVEIMRPGDPPTDPKKNDWDFIVEKGGYITKIQGGTVEYKGKGKFVDTGWWKYAGKGAREATKQEKDWLIDWLKKLAEKLKQKLKPDC